MNHNGSYTALIRKFAGSDVTWAGAHPFVPGLCFGFDDGTLLFTDENAESDKLPQKLSKSGEPVNGLASYGANSVAVSTRADVTFVEVNANKETSISIFRGGAHGVVATHSGYFVSPLGVHGLLVVKPELGEKQQMKVTEGTKGQLYFYRALPIHDSKRNETIAFALRKDGIGVTPFKGYETVRNVHTITSYGLDVIDLCTIRKGSQAVAAISIDGILMLFGDVVNKQQPITFKLGGVEGMVYRVLSSRGHLFVLTSKAMYVWLGLTDGFLNGNPIEENAVPLVLPMAAVDANLYRDDLLLVVMAANEVQRIDIRTIEKLPTEFPLHPERFVRTPLEPKWQENDVEQSSSLASVG